MKKVIPTNNNNKASKNKVKTKGLFTIEQINNIIAYVNNEINKANKQMYTCFPCKVTEVNKDNQTVSIQILHNGLVYDQETKQYINAKYPVIPDIPIVNNPLITTKVAKDDIGLYQVSYSNLDTYIEGKEPAEVDNDINDLGDGFFIPQGYSPNALYKVDDDVGISLDAKGDKLIIKNDQQNIKDILDKTYDSIDKIASEVKDFINDFIAAIPSVTGMPAPPYAPPTIAKHTVTIANIDVEIQKIKQDKNDLDQLLK